MRLRLESSPALPHFKAWFSSSRNTSSSQQKSGTQTILDLKRSICSTIKPLAEGGFVAEDLLLEFDGFELLDAFSAEEIIREGDLVVVGLREKAVETLTDVRPVSDTNKKRKLGAESTRNEPSKKRRKARLPSTSPESSSSSSESSSSSSESSSDSESDSDSSDSDSTSSDDSDSDSDSDSDASSSSSAPLEVSSKPSTVKVASNPTQKPNATEKHVPPGHGSSQTKKRNLRRKLKKQHDLAATRGGTIVASVPKGLSEANLAPLGPRTPVTTQPNPSTSAVSVPTVVEEDVTTQLPMDPARDSDLNISMFSLGNKNKKKGYKKQTLGFPNVTAKIVFDKTQEQETQEGELLLPFTAAPVPQIRPRLVPPSEKQDLGLLPRNVWVSSVDVEEGLSKSRKKQKQKQRQRDVVEPVPIPEPSADFVSCQREEEEVMDLDYGDPEDDGEDAKTKLLWTIAEQTYDSLVPVSADEKDRIQPGVVIAWRALMLNPTTFSPEILLQLASVLSTSTDNVVIRKIVRSGWEDWVEVEDEPVEWTRALEEGWRIFKTTS